MLIEENGFKIFIAHGHQGDMLCKEKSCASCLVCCADQVISSIEESTKLNIEDEISHLSSAIGTNDKTITKYALNIAKTMGYDVVIFGHTHNQMSELANKKNVIDNKTYINDGCLVGKGDEINDCILEIITDRIKIQNRVINIRTNEVVKNELTQIIKIQV